MTTASKSNAYAAQLKRWRQPGSAGFFAFLADAKPMIPSDKGGWQPYELPSDLVRDEIARALDNPLHSTIVWCWPRRHGKTVVAALVNVWRFLTRQTEAIAVVANSEKQTVDTAFRLFKGILQQTPYMKALINSGAIKVGAALYAAIGANVILKKANRLTKLCKTTALQVGWNGTAPTLAVVTPNILDAVWDGDPENPFRLIVTHPGLKAQDTTYSDWTAATWQKLDARGHVIPSRGNPNGVNPYGILPFVPLFDFAPDDQFFLPGGDDLVEAQRAVNVALANLWRAIELQSHGQAWAAGLPAGDAVRAGPDRTIALPENGTFGFAAPGTPIEQVLKAIEFVIKQTAVANDLAANLFEIDPKAESGTAKFAESIDLLEARQDDIELWRKYEAQLFEVIKRVVNTHAPGTIPESATVRVDFGEVDEGADEKTRLDAYAKRIELGLWSPVDALMADNPDVRTRDDAMKILTERALETAQLGMTMIPAADEPSAIEVEATQ